MTIRQFKAGDTPILTAQLAQETSVDEDGEPGYEGIELEEVELEEATVLVYIRHEASGSIVAAGDEADVVDVKEGYVEYAMDATQTAAPGEYTVEFVATWPDSHADKPGHKHTWPTEGYETIEATDSINRDASLDVVEIDVEFDHVDANSATIDSLSAGALENEVDRYIGTDADVNDLSNTISDNEVIVIGRPETPYELTDWLDIDGVSNVTIQTQSPYAANGAPIFKTADGADVGGIRLGSSTACENIILSGVGHDGNPENQDSSVFDLDSIQVHNATNTTIEKFHLQRQSPFRVHNDGGSGITVFETAQDTTIRHGFIPNPGDRGMQISGQVGEIYGVVESDGYDRMASFRSTAKNWRVSNIHGRNIIDGAMIGFDGGAESIHCYNVSSYNVERGLTRAGASASSGDRPTDIVIDGGYAYSDTPVESGMRTDNGLTNATFRNIKVYATDAINHGIRIVPDTNPENVRFQNVDIHIEGTGDVFRGITVGDAGTSWENVWVTGSNLDQSIDIQEDITVKNGHFNAGNEDVRITSGVSTARLLNVEYGSLVENGSGNLINGVGDEAAGAGNPPAGSKWSVGDQIFNTDDSTLWLKAKDGTMVQIV